MLVSFFRGAVRSMPGYEKMKRLAPFLCVI